MAKPKKPSEKIKSGLLEAVQFLSCVTSDTGAPYETHILLANKTATATNGVLAAGQIIEEDIFCAPHNSTLISALKKCGQEFSLTQLDVARVSIKAGRFKAVVPCIDPTTLLNPMPDNPVAIIDGRLKEALSVIEPIKTPNPQRVIEASFLLNGQTVIATDGKIILEYWHGIDLPPNVAIPKALIPAIINHSKNLSHFGFSTSSATFYFEDGSWIKTQLYAEKWPNTDHILNKPSEALPVPVDFFVGLNAVKDFSENGTVHFDNGAIKSHRDEGKGAIYEVPGLIKGPVFSHKYLSMLKDIALQIDYETNDKMLYFFGKNCRGAVMGHG